MNNFKEKMYNVFSFVLAWIAILAYILILRELIKEFDFFIGFLFWIAIIFMTFYCFCYSNNLKNEIEHDKDMFYKKMIEFIKYTFYFDYSKLEIVYNITCTYSEIKIFLKNNITISHSILMRTTDFFDIDINLLDKLLLSYDYNGLQNKEPFLQSVYLNDYIQKNSKQLKKEF